MADVDIYELKMQKAKLEADNRDLLKRGEKTEPSAGAWSFVLSWFVGAAANIAKIIWVGWVAFPWGDGAPKFLCAIAEIIAMFVITWIVLFFIIKPFDFYKTRRYKQEMTKKEYEEYLRIRDEIKKIDVQLPYEKNESSYSGDDSDSSGSCPSGGCM